MKVIMNKSLALKEKYFDYAIFSKDNIIFLKLTHKTLLNLINNNLNYFEILIMGIDEI